MTKKDVINILKALLEDTSTAVLSSVDEKNRPSVRWMSPVFLRGEKETLYAITAPGFSKLAGLKKNPHVEWMFQPPLLNVVINLKGVVNIVDNSQLRSQVLEALQNKLTVFWKVNQEASDLLILETVIQQAVVLVPMTGLKTVVEFTSEGKG